MRNITYPFFMVEEAGVFVATLIDYPISVQAKDFNSIQEVLKDNFKEILISNFKEKIPAHKASKVTPKLIKRVKEEYELESKEIIISNLIIEEELLFSKEALKAERTNVSIKKYLKDYAKDEGINISDFLNNQLAKKMGFNN